MIQSLKKINRFDGATVIILLIITVLLIWEPLLTIGQFHDVTYHVLVAQNFERAGGIVTWDFWESPPEGRAHLYPPLTQLLISFLVKLQLDSYSIIRLITIVAIVGALALSWFGLRQLFNQRTAFLFIVLASGALPYLFFLGILMPASLVLAASPLLVWLIIRQRILGALALLTLMLYTHMVLPWLIVGGLAVWILFNPDYRRTTVFAVGGATILYLPWAFHIAKNFHYIKYFNPDYEAASYVNDFSLNLFVAGILLIALIYLIWRWNSYQTQRTLFFVTLFAIQLPLAASPFPPRFFTSGGFFAATIIIACAINRLLETRPKRSVIGIITAILLITHLGNYSLFIRPSGQIVEGLWERSTLVQTLQLKQASETSYLNVRQNTITRVNRRIAEAIAQATEPDEIIYNTSHALNTDLYSDRLKHLIAQLFATLSNRGLGNVRLPEYYWRTPLPLNQATIVLADYQDTDLSPVPKTPEAEALAATLRTDFELIHRENRLAVFKNKNPDTLKIKPTKPIINQWLALALIIAFIGLVIHEVRQARRSTTARQPLMK
jgi:hypothetical protein